MFQQVVDQELTVAFYGPQPFLIALTPNAAERVLSNSENLNKSFLYDMMKSWIGNGLLTSDKDIWKKRRKVLTPAFHFRVLEDYVPVMNRRASELVKKMNSLSSGSFDLLPVMRIAAFGILFETAMGIQLDENEVLRTGFLQVNDEISSSIIARMLNIYHWLDITYGSTGPKVSSRGGGFCCVQNIATDDEGEDLASAVTATAAVRSQASRTKMARFHELKRQASASTSSQTSSPELRKREASPPLCTVTLRGRTVVKKSSPDSKDAILEVVLDNVEDDVKVIIWKDLYDHL
ncbi:cytochrome P450 4V2 [Ixodes scapularis]